MRQFPSSEKALKNSLNAETRKRAEKKAGSNSGTRGKESGLVARLLPGVNIDALRETGASRRRNFVIKGISVF
jgi:hypothetical protein